MEAREQFFIITTTLAGMVFVFFIALILFIDIRNMILSKRIKAKVIRIVESPWTDDDGVGRIMRYPEIEFVDPNGKTIIHQMVLTNMTWRKPGDKFKIYYRPMKNTVGYKICAPFMWPKIILLFFSNSCCTHAIVWSTQTVVSHFSHRLRRDDALPSLISKEAYRPLCEKILDF